MKRRNWILKLWADTDNIAVPPPKQGYKLLLQALGQYGLSFSDYGRLEAGGPIPRGIQVYSPVSSLEPFAGIAIFTVATTSFLFIQVLFYLPFQGSL